MGILDSLFGKKDETAELPALEDGSPAARQVDEHRADLKSLAERSNDRLEAVPGRQYLYVYLGDPPKKFGVVWYEDDREHIFAEEMKKRGLAGTRIQELSDELRTAYEETEGAPRYSYDVGGRTIVVTPSDELARRLNEAIHEVEAA